MVWLSALERFLLESLTRYVPRASSYSSTSFSSLATSFDFSGSYVSISSRDRRIASLVISAISLTLPLHISIAKAGLSRNLSSIETTGASFSGAGSSLSGIVTSASLTSQLANGNRRIVAPILNKLCITAIPAADALSPRNPKLAK